MKKSDRWKKREEEKLKKLVLMRWGLIALTGLIGSGIMWLHFKGQSKVSEDTTVSNLEGRSVDFPDEPKLIVTYNDAQNNSDLRQKYIDLHFNGKLPYFVSELVYDPDNSKTINYLEGLLSKDFIDDELMIKMKNELESGSTVPMYLMRVFLTNRTFGNGIKQPIFVTPRAFKNYNEKEFRKALVDHEFIHAKDLFSGIQIGNVLINYENSHFLQSNTINAIFDLRALHNQMLVSVFGGEEPDELFLQAMVGYVKYYQMLRDVKPMGELEKYVRDNQLKFYLSFMTSKMRSNLRD